MLVIYVKDGRVTSIEAMTGTSIIVPLKDHVEGEPDSIDLENTKDYTVVYEDEVEAFANQLEVEEGAY